ncbi:MAG TPA: radical SAM family heme chaperone HemW [Draconibacterium sp.]|nr:radical SAM family heme chaperone HemW [Draconibacterium sp.]
MAGIYIHIPFCRQKCYYCDFYKTVNTTLTEKFLSALKTEIIQRKKYFDNEEVETIYFGGGTPSVLTKKELNEILDFLKYHFNVSKTAEITFEANPDDLSIDYLIDICSAGVCRLSIGIQSFQNEFLKKMNRRHDADQAIQAVVNAANIGFSDISVDLIYGLPGLKINQWKADLEKIFKLPIQHLSAYHLTYHKGTPFYTWLKKGTLKALNETESILQFETLVKLAKENGFEQYEISNFARDGKYSKHNSSYWKGVKYLGLGPSAHSFNGVSRSWNVSHIESYIKAIDAGLPFYEEEILSDNNKYNEFILTRIRTIWGVSQYELEERFGPEKSSYFKINIDKYLNTGLVKLNNGIYNLTEKGMFVSDEIMANLMFI